jgi:hypothetical protein
MSCPHECVMFVMRKRGVVHKITNVAFGMHVLR